MKPIRSRSLLAGLITLSVIGSVAITLIFRQQIRSWLVVPVSYVVWYINLILETVPQPIFWVILVLGGFFLSIRTILKNLPQSDLPPEPTYSGLSASRYQYWLWYISTYQISPFSSENLARNLSRLVMDVLAYQEHLTISELEEMIRSGKLNLPEDIREFLITRRLVPPQPAPPLVLRWFDRLRRRRTRQRRPPSPESLEAHQKLERVIQFIEERLELQHGISL
uniref:Uncharacterized protein n=1 Tax=Anaerolinea thermolimosa TaxID=229919 RepID=A0A7C4KHY3_9CHLR